MGLRERGLWDAKLVPPGGGGEEKKGASSSPVDHGKTGELQLSRVIYSQDDMGLFPELPEVNLAGIGTSAGTVVFLLFLIILLMFF